jgi:HD-GYP domain-containing protein (c-di-GMP phosphodiesterase class II)
VEIVRQSALMHDIGKIGCVMNLNKPGKLTQDEYEMFKKHPGYGKDILEPIKFLNPLIPGVYLHHERWDGAGYPGYVDLDGRPIVDPATGLPRAGGKRGEDIPLFARIVGLADVFDALSSRRAYKDAWSEDQVLEYVRAESGRHFDPELVDILFSRLDELRSVRSAHMGD